MLYKGTNNSACKTTNCGVKQRWFYQLAVPAVLSQWTGKSQKMAVAKKTEISLYLTVSNGNHKDFRKVADINFLGSPDLVGFF